MHAFFFFRTYRCTYAYHIRVQAIVDVEQTKFMTPNFSLYLDPQTTIYKQLFQLDDEPNLYILLMAEILHHLGCRNPVNNGIFTISTGWLDFRHQQ